MTMRATTRMRTHGAFLSLSWDAAEAMIEEEVEVQILGQSGAHDKMKKPLSCILCAVESAGQPAQAPQGECTLT